MNFNISNLASLVFSSVNKTVNSTQSQVQNQNNISTPKEKFNPSPSNNELLSNMSSGQLSNLTKQVSQSAANIMSNVQQNIFLRDMLDLPKDWAYLLKEFSFSKNAQLANMLKNLSSTNQSSLQEALLVLANANTRVNLAALAEHLSKNSTLLADKLLKYMGSANMSQNNIAQLKNIMLIGASIASSANVNPQEFIRDIIQMYLPWLPLVPPKEEDLSEIEAKTSGTATKDGQILFYISTNNIGYFKIEILLDEEAEIYITNVTEIANDDLKNDLCKLLKANIKTIAQNAKLFYSRKLDDENLNLKEKQIFIVNSNDSMLGLSLIHLLAKTIFEFDEKEAQRFLKNEQTN